MGDTILTDPLGRAIVLHDHTWYGHILKGHPEMKCERGSAESALSAPISIHFSTSDPDCRLYFGKTSNPGVLVAVVVDVAGSFVKTAYRTARTKGAVEWSP